MKKHLSHQTFSAISFLPLAANPFMIWSKIAWNATEMLMASAQVIHHRTGRIAKAGAIPNRKDQREFLLMGQEKFDAAAESAQAVTLRMFRMNQEIGSLLFRQMVAGTGSLLALGGARAGMPSSALQTALVRNTIANSTDLTAQFMRSLAKVAHHGLQPIHIRATANARRLGKFKA